MVEGVSIRAIARMTGASKNTIVKLLADAGQACSEYQDKALRNLPCKRIQADEIWSFVYAKQENVPEPMRGQFGVGDVWTWTALCADTKLIVRWCVDTRDADAAHPFMTDLANRLANRVQLTTDGHRAYLDAVDSAFRNGIDYAMLVKIYGKAVAETRYSPPVCLGAERTESAGIPIPTISAPALSSARTSDADGNPALHSADQCFFKEAGEPRLRALDLLHALQFRSDPPDAQVTPAMEAGVTDGLWSLEDMVGIVDEWEAAQKDKESAVTP